MKDKPIGVFDSGLGGLAVARKVMDLMPQEDILYFSDFKNLPYGPRPQQEVKGFTLRIVDFLIKHGVKAVIIGCNTASAAGAEEAYQQAGEIRVIGMIEPAIRATLAMDQVSRVGVIGTEGTISSGAYEKAFALASRTIAVYGSACPAILRLAEQGDIGDKVKIRDLAKECVASLEKARVEVIILGCTDFTCITDDLKAVVMPEIKIIDPASESVRLAETFLLEKGWRKSDGKGAIRFLATGPRPKDSVAFARKVFGIKMGEVTLVNP